MLREGLQKLRQANTSWRCAQKGGGATALRRLSLGCKSFTCSPGPVVPGKYNCLATLVISHLETQIWLHVMAEFKNNAIYIASDTQRHCPSPQWCHHSWLPFYHNVFILLTKKLQTCRRKNVGLWIQVALANPAKSCQILPLSRNYCTRY